MSQPTPYTPTTDFSQQEANNASGRSTVNTSALDAEFANIETTLDQVIENIQLIQRDDGKLGDVLVEVRCLAPDTLNLMGGFKLTGLWSAGKDYAVNNIASNGEYTYVCKIPHTSGASFDEQYWEQFGFTAGADAAQAAAEAQASALSAYASETNALSYKNAAQNSASSAVTSASSASSSASIAANHASQASASATTAANISAAIAASSVTPSSTTTMTNKTLGAATNVIEATSGPGATQFSHRNKIINGDFRINQRGYSAGAAVGSSLYGHDRWKMAASGDTYTYSTTANKTTITIPSGKVLRQVIEGNNLQTGTYVLSWEGTAQGKIGGGALSASGIEGSITGGTDTIIEFGQGTVSNVQLEIGTIATPFEHRPYAVELALCHRYFWSSGVFQGATVAVGQAFSSSTLGFVLSLPVAMRAAPTWSVSNVVGNTASGSPASISAIPGGSNIAGNIAYSGVSTISSVLVAGAATAIAVGSSGNNGYINLSSEL